jgi:dTDP-glucose 4,6-dehydratase
MYLVTGGAGFIGSALVRQLLRRSESVVNVDRLTYAANPASLADVATDERYQFARVDICDADAVREVFRRHQPDTVLHLAAESHVDRSIDAPDDFIRTNVVGTFTMLGEARRYWELLPADRAKRFRFIHVSTDEVFGALGPTGQFNESSRYDPSSPYSATKAGSDHLARAWHKTYGLPVIVSYASNNFGPRQFPEKLVPLTILNALDRKPIDVYGDGRNVRDWIYVDDHCDALLSLVDRGSVGSTYAIGGGNERTNLDVVTAICDIVDALDVANGQPRRELIRFVGDRPGHDFRYSLDTTRIRTELGWTSQTPFDAALAATVHWYIDHPQWWQPIRERGSIGPRLGLEKRA